MSSHTKQDQSQNDGTRSALYWRPHPHVLAKRLGEETILVHLETNRIYELSSTASRFWELLSAGWSREQMCSQLLQEFAVDETQLGGEIDALLSSCLNAQLITADDGI
jgi:hypothetical protein